jgi:hypothetical protein
MRPECLGALKKCIHLMGFRTYDLPACSIVPEPVRHRVPPWKWQEVCESGRGSRNNNETASYVMLRFDAGV